MAMHWLRECTEASEDDKKEIVQKLRDARKTKKARTKRLGELLPNTERHVAEWSLEATELP